MHHWKMHSLTLQCLNKFHLHAILTLIENRDRCRSDSIFFWRPCNNFLPLTKASVCNWISMRNEKGGWLEIIVICNIGPTRWSNYEWRVPRSESAAGQSFSQSQPTLLGQLMADIFCSYFINNWMTRISYIFVCLKDFLMILRFLK